MAILNEHGPRDLFRAYANSRINVHDWDFENSEFKEISKEEAKEVINNGEGNRIHLIIEGKLVMLRPNGKCSPLTDISLDNEDHWYTAPDGYITYRTESMPSDHLLEIADKIYLVKLARRDSDKENARMAKNNEIASAMHFFNRDSFSVSNSPFTSRGYGAHNLNYRDYERKSISGQTDKYYSDDLEQAEHKVQKYKLLMKKASEKADEATRDGDTTAMMSAMSAYRQYANELNNAEQELKDLKKYIRNTKNDEKDTAAAVRNALSMKNLQDRIMSKKQQLKRAKELEAERERVAKELENVRLNGSEYTRSLRKQAQELTQQIRDVQKKIAALTLYLEDTSEDDANALKAAQEQQADLMRQLGDIQGFIDKLEEIKNRRG